MSLLRIFLFASAMLANTIVPDALAANPVAANGATRVSFAREQAARTRSSAGLSVQAAAVQPKELVANNYRAYPASCLSYPLPAAPSGPTFTSTVTLNAYNSFDPSSGKIYTEDVTITIWRVACGNTSLNVVSSSLPAYNPYGNVPGPVSVTLMRIQRSPGSDHSNIYYPTFPGVHIAQGSTTFDNPNDTDFVRVASEPNTVVADTQIYAPIIDSKTYVLENNPATQGYFYFNNAFRIRFDNFIYAGTVTRQVFTDVTAYSPTSADYPAAFQPLPISGYMTGSWYDPTHGGEGILSNVLENSDGVTRTFIATWYTYDQTGLPFWLIAQGNLNIGDTQVQNMTVQYLTGGGFGGAFTPPLARPIWGIMSVQFTDCNTMMLSYSGSAAPVNGPVSNGSQTRTWTRIGNINSLTCQ